MAWVLSRNVEGESDFSFNLAETTCVLQGVRRILLFLLGGGQAVASSDAYHEKCVQKSVHSAHDDPWGILHFLGT